MTVRAVIFDIEGTLIRRDGGTPTERTMEGLRRAYDVLVEGGLPLPDFRTTFSMVHREVGNVSAGLVYGNFREMSIPGMVKRFLKRAFPEVSSSRIDAALEAWYAPMADSARVTPGAREALEGATALGLAVAGAGNTPWGGSYLKRDLDRAGLSDLLSVVVGSADVGFRKPNLFLLSKTLEKLGVPGEETVHVGDDPREDLEAPQELDMRAVLVAPPGSAPRADRTIADLRQLEGVLREWTEA
jgi:FMN phosphatase YigB (HAD superfamily)